MQKRPLREGFEEEYARQLVGVDTLFGGDIGPPDGGAHLIADSFPKDEVLLPEVYHDERAIALRTSGGANRDNAKLVRSFIHDHHLLDARERLVEALGNGGSPLRRKTMENLGECLGVMARTALAIAEGEPLPPYEQRYRASAKREPTLINTEELRERLQAALAGVGFEVTPSRDLRSTLQAWEQGVGFVSPQAFASTMGQTDDALLANARANILRAVDFGIEGYDPHLDDIPFDALELKTVSGVGFTGSSAYQGGLTPAGKPALRGLIELNTDHPLSNTSKWHLAAHEMKPGHYLDFVIADLRWHTGQIGFEAVAGTMCTAGVTLREGWAQNALAMAYGGSEQNVVDVLGSNHAVEYAVQRLQDAGKQNASVLFQLRAQPEAAVKDHLRNDCVLSDALVAKLAGGWAKHPIIGPMYGCSYPVGYEVVRKAIDQHGLAKVAEAALHGRGYLDIETFQMALRE